MRCDLKMLYARIHIDELENYSKKASNNDWEHAHQEAVFNQLVSATEAILHEINIGYSLNLGLENIREKSIEKGLKSNGQDSQAFDYWKEAKEQDWRKLLFNFRIYGAHRERLNKVMQTTGSIGAKRPVDHVDRIEDEFIDPSTRKRQTVYPGLGCQDVLEKLAGDVEKLIDHCRSIDNKLQ